LNITATRPTAARCRRAGAAGTLHPPRSRAYRIPILELAGYEADDVIGTLARKAAAQQYLVYVVSNDKDMLQLVNHNVWF